MKPFAIGLAVGLSLALAGCGSKPTVVGKWKVDPQMVSNQPAGLPAGFMTGFATSFKYEFKADNSFTGPLNAGTYTIDGAKISMTNKTMMGQDFSKLGVSAAAAQITGELATDGQSMVLHPGVIATAMPALANIKMVPDK